MDTSTAVTADGNSVRVWAIKTGRKIATLHPRMNATVTALDFDSSTVCAGDASGTIRVWNSIDFVQARVIKAYSDAVVAVLKLDAVIIAASRTGQVDVWGTDSAHALLRHDHPGSELMDLAASDKVLAVYGTHGVSLYDMES